MVAMTSSGGVPSSSVMIENWWTSIARTVRHTFVTPSFELTIFSWEQGLALEHLGKDAAGTPDVHYVL